MRNFLRIIMCVLFAAGFSGQGLCADRGSLINQALKDTEKLLYSSNQRTINRIQKELSLRMKKNSELRTKYDVLKEELKQIQKNLVQGRRELNTLEKQQKENELVRRRQAASKIKDLRKAEGEVQLLESKAIYLKGQVLDIDERLRLGKMKLADMQFEERKLSLESEDLAKKQKEQALAWEKEETQLRAKLTASLEKQARLKHLIEEKRQTGEKASEIIHRLTTENTVYEKNVEAYRRKKEIKEQELALWKKKQLFSKKSLESVLTPQAQYYKKLKIFVSELEREYKSMDRNLEALLHVRDERQRLMKLIIQADKENQDLRAQVSMLEKKKKQLN